MSGGIQSLNTASALLEFKFANAIQKLTQERPAVIGYLAGNGEPLSYNVYDLIERTIKPELRVWICTDRQCSGNSARI